jgi:hypothetical protein
MDATSNSEGSTKMDVSVNKAKTHSIINRVRNAIKKFDPSYHLKEQGHICAKEWREIIGTPLDFIWGDGYTNMAKMLCERYSDSETLAVKFEVLRSASRDPVKLKTLTELEKDAVVRYCMNDVMMNRSILA